MSPARDLLDKYFERIISRLPKDLKEIADDLTQVVCYPDVEQWGLQASPSNWLFLRDIGLPESCPGMIDLDDVPRKLNDSIQIGSNNYGDPVCIEKDSGAVVYYEHDGENKRHEINKSPLDFLASISAFDQQALTITRAAIKKIDPEAIREGQWWYQVTS